MIFSKKKRNKPFYKQFLIIRKNIQNRRKLFKFKKQKWKLLQEYSFKQAAFFKRYKLKDQFKLGTKKFANRGNSFKKKFRTNYQIRKTFNLFYGGFKKKYLKKAINNIRIEKSCEKNCFRNHRHKVLQFFESRLDTILYRAKFSLSVSSARQLIKHGHVLVNGVVTKAYAFILKTDDLVEISLNRKSRSLLNSNIKQASFWPLPPKYLVINYETCQIILIDNKNFNFSPVFTHFLNIDSILRKINRF